MPLPVATCAAEVPTDTCCYTLYDIANRLRCVVTDALCECFEGGCADREFRSFVSVGPQIEDPQGDSLIVHMPRVILMPLSTTSNSALLPIAVHVAEFEIRLLERGWPTIEVNDLENEIYVPDYEYVNAMARHVYSHGERMYRAIVDGIQHRTLFTLATSDVANIRLSDFTPIQPSGELAGWTMTLQVEVTFPSPYRWFVMANIVEVKLKIEREKMGAFVDKLEKLSAQQTFDRLTVAAGYLEGQVVIEMRNSGMVLDRSAHRRKKGTTRIINSFRGRVDGTPNRFPIRLILEPKPGVSHKKVASLEKGTKGHTRGTPYRFPAPQRYNKAGAPIGRIVGPAKFRNAYGKNNFSAKAQLQLPSRPGFHFMEKAIKETIRAMKTGRV